MTGLTFVGALYTLAVAVPTVKRMSCASNAVARWTAVFGWNVLADGGAA